MFVFIIIIAAAVLCILGVIDVERQIRKIDKDQDMKTWTEIWKEWLSQATKFNISNFFDWLSENYEVPQKKKK